MPVLALTRGASTAGDSKPGSSILGAAGFVNATPTRKERTATARTLLEMLFLGKLVLRGDPFWFSASMKPLL